MHVQPQVPPPLQVRVEFAGPAAHGVQLVPQLFTSVSATHDEPQRW